MATAHTAHTAAAGASPAAAGQPGIEFGVYLPQVALDFEFMLDRALACERLGYDAFWLFDHLYAPGLPAVPSLEGWTLATALLARTTRLRGGHLVTCNNFRHPALLARMAATADVISGGRVELGLGSGSVEQEHLQAGFPWGTPRERGERLGEALEIITRMFAAPRTTFEGRHYAVHDLPNLPGPVQRPRPRIHLGGVGPRWTLPLVARYADVWNVPTYALDRIGELSRALDAECERIGRERRGGRRPLPTHRGDLRPCPAASGRAWQPPRPVGAPGPAPERGGLSPQSWQPPHLRC
ncbi:LLM class flavin-dependent oxidoreductase [Frankia sp. AgKG'84/4]|uniref:LLM class flavin-dependent oxidoreductase n=1 Tax=Frankia sp. AgKG'84/4 TaxID=573490 RepID=UPI00200DE6A4|nr:LLM class flavin-dependent oxidoreductase [Frankia sp. AgKG'84/4]MCL9794581.1 LLM class flavin-dependent oxidoreductase [Frankia sp. AgKG'84/4]